MNEVVLLTRQVWPSVVFRIDCYPEGTQLMIATRMGGAFIREAWLFDSLEKAIAQGAKCLTEWTCYTSPIPYFSTNERIENTYLEELEKALAVYSDLLRQLFECASKYQVVIPDKERWVLPPQPKKRTRRARLEWIKECQAIMQRNRGDEQN